MEIKVKPLYKGMMLNNEIGLIEEGSYKNWLVVKHPDGQWVTLCELPTPAPAMLLDEKAIYSEIDKKYVNCDSDAWEIAKDLAAKFSRPALEEKVIYEAITNFRSTRKVYDQADCIDLAKAIKAKIEGGRWPMTGNGDLS